MSNVIYMNGRATDLENIFDAINPGRPDLWHTVSVKDTGRALGDILDDWINKKKTHYYLNGIKTTFELKANSAPAREGGKKMKQWNGTDASGRYQYPADQISAWNMTIDEGGTVYYIPHDGKNEPRIWCPAADLTRHMHRLEQIAARR